MTERYQILEGYQERQTIIKILDSDNEEDQIEIEKNKRDAERILPRIVEFFKDKFGDDLLKLKVEEQGAHYGNENYSTKKIKLLFYFPESHSNLTKREIFNDLKSFFNIDLRYYGTPLEIEVYRMKWESL